MAKKTRKQQDTVVATPESDTLPDQALEVLHDSQDAHTTQDLQRLHAPSDAIALLMPDELQAQIEVETSKRQLLTNYIAKHMVDGVDYGKIHLAKNCANKYHCQNPYHFSKDVLFKPGAEKFCSLFRLRAAFARDDETWEMMGRPAGLVCYVCHLYTTHGILAGEGRGAASIEEKGNANTAIKIAEKRAKMDAVLSTGGLSDFFTQDLEDDQDQEELTLRMQKAKIVSLLKQLGLSATDKAGYEAAVKAQTDLELVSHNYRAIILRLSAKVGEVEEKPFEVLS